MVNFTSPFGGDEDEIFDDYDEYIPEHIPEPGKYLSGHDVLTDERHVEFHKLTRDLFEERKVYDMTFNYNLARLNLDNRHPDSGYRYAEDSDDTSVLWAEFTPTTPFCPQSHTLTIGSFRAWNGLSERHDYSLVKVRVDEMHHQSEEINDKLRKIEEKFEKDEVITDIVNKDIGSNPMERTMKRERNTRGDMNG